MAAAKRNLSDGVPRLVMRVFYQWRYFRGKTPWDTNITPPEVVELIEREKFPSGRALDLGCGTGTNSIYLARHGFEVIGVDFVGRALEMARSKAQVQNVRVEFRAADVLAPGEFGKAFDLILDIGCFHSIDPSGRVRYADNARQWTHPGSLLMLYAFFPRKFFGRSIGVTRDEMEKLFAVDFVLRNYADDGKSAWYRWERK